MNEIPALGSSGNSLWYLPLIRDEIPINFYKNIFNIPVMSVYSLRKLPEQKYVILENSTEKTKPSLKSVFIFSAELLL